MTYQNPKAVYACVNLSEAYCPKEIQKRAICIDGDIGKLLCELCLKPNAAAKSQVLHMCIRDRRYADQPGLSNLSKELHQYRYFHH